MRAARRSSSAYDGLFSALRAFLARRAQELTGLCLIAVAGAVAVALGTWSVDDPSLNNATDLPVRNLIGWPGAIVADLLMQLLGLGAIAAVLPLALWGWRLMKSGELGRIQLRLALWVIGAGAATALASALPPTQSWPLPTASAAWSATRSWPAQRPSRGFPAARPARCWASCSQASRS
jgi:S-DNA-T family DNA segregation ATPase FtsK/SpoIIIE